MKSRIILSKLRNQILFLMKKGLFRILGLIIGFYLLTVAGVGQTYSIAWDKTFGTRHSDGAMTVLPAADGNIMIFGYYGFDMFALKLDTAGNTIWEKTYGSFRGQEACFAAVESFEKDGYVLAGFTDAPRPEGDQSHEPKGGLDVWILKIDHDGNKVWDQRYGGSGVEQANSIQVTSFGYAIGAITQSMASGDVSGEPRGSNLNGFAGYDYWFLMLDAQGNLKRETRFGGDSWDEFFYGNIIQLSADRFAFCGTTHSGKTGDITTPSYGQDDNLLIITDSLLNVVSQRRFGGNLSEENRSSIKKRSHCYFAGSSTSFISGSKNSDNIGLTGLSDGWIVKTDLSGNKIWDKSIGGTGQDEIFRIKTWGDQLVLTGQSNSNQGFYKSENCRGDYDFWIMVTDTNLNKIWDKTVGGGRIYMRYANFTGRVYHSGGG